MEDYKDINSYIKNIYDVNLYTAIKYLCGLACITDNCKSYNFKKEQLLIIYKLCCVKNNINIWKYDDDCAKLFLKENGRLSLKGYGWIDSFYTVKEYEKTFDINKRIEDDLSDISKIYSIYKIDKYETFPNESKELLTEIFREFGGYDAKIIAKWLEEIVEYSTKYNLNDITDNLKCCLQDKKSISNLKENKIFNFIITYNLKTNNNNLGFDISKASSKFKDIFTEMTFEEQKELLLELDIIEKELINRERNKFEFNNQKENDINIKNRFLKILKR